MENDKSNLPEIIKEKFTNNVELQKLSEIRKEIKETNELLRDIKSFLKSKSS